MSIWRAFVVVAGFAFAFAVLGGALGSFIGQFSPDYYRAVFSMSRRPVLDPVEVGIGLGLNQGWAVGLLTGLVVVGLFAWKDLRLDKVALVVAPHIVRRPERTGALLVLVVVLAIFAAIFTGLLGMVMGFSDGRYYAEQQVEQEQRRQLSAILDEPKYGQVGVSNNIDGSILLAGKVANQADLEALQERLVREFGTRFAEAVIRGVRTEQPANGPPLDGERFTSRDE